MSEHWNIQISIQRVEEPEPVKDRNGYDLKAIGGQIIKTERKVNKVLDMAIVADTERDAYAKAHKMLSANEPEWPESYEVTTDSGTVARFTPSGQAPSHLHRASCHGPAGELHCGFPANGPTI